MKFGFDNKRELAWMAGLVVLALLLGTRFFFSDDPVVTAPKTVGSQNKAKPSAATEVVSTRGQKRVRVLATLKPSLDPSLRFDLLRSSEDREYTGGARNIFREHVEVAKIEKPVMPVINPTPVDTGPPPPPPINLKYYGFASKPGEARKVFLSSGDEVFIAEEGQIIQRRYRIVKITASSVEVEDVLNNIKQTIPLTQG